MTSLAIAALVFFATKASIASTVPAFLRLAQLGARQENGAGSLLVSFAVLEVRAIALRRVCRLREREHSVVAHGVAHLPESGSAAAPRITASTQRCRSQIGVESFSGTLRPERARDRRRLQRVELEQV